VVYSVENEDIASEENTCALEYLSGKLGNAEEKRREKGQRRGKFKTVSRRKKEK